MAVSSLALFALGPLADGGHKGPALLALVVANVGAWADHGPRATMWEGLVPGEAQAAAFAVINSLGNVGGFLGSYLLGALKGSESVGTAELACLMGLASVMTLAYRPAGKHHTASRPPAGIALGPVRRGGGSRAGSAAGLGDAEEEEDAGKGNETARLLRDE